MARTPTALVLAGLLVVAGCIPAPEAPSQTPSASAAIASLSPSPASPSLPPIIESASPNTSASASLTGLPPGDPNPSLTPGAVNSAVTQASIGQTICVAGFTKSIRPPATYTNQLKRQQIAEYGYSDTNPTDYEEDHLISLELGGAPAAPENLWPEPHRAQLPDGTDVGSATKDRFENWLHARVCGGALALAMAQQEIARDWVGAWQAAGRP